MNPESPPRFDVATLHDLAGRGAFARGEAYCRNGRVELLEVASARVLARVSGTEVYRTVLTGRSRNIGGECSCPAFERDGFCKHMVATALAVNAADGNGEGSSALSRIRDYLKSRDIDTLVETIIEMADRDPGYWRRLELAAAAIDADDKTLEAQLRKMLGDATRTRGFVDYGSAAAWADGVAAALDTLGEFAAGERAGLVAKLAEYAIGRIEQAIEKIDDSDGHCSVLLERACEIHLRACRATRPDGVALARQLFTWETEGQYDTFRNALAIYEDVLGEEGLAEYRRLAEKTWKELPAPKADGPRDRHIFDSDRFHLASILDFFAEREGDLETRIAIRAADLSSPWSYHQLASFCREHGRVEEALRHAEDGLWVYEDQLPDERLVLLAVELLLQVGRQADAESHLWRAFDKLPSDRLYTAIAKLGGKAASRRAIAVLESRLADGEKTAWRSSADLLIRILMKEQLFDAAWSAVRRHGAATSIRIELAKATETTHASDALAVYTQCVEDFARTGSASTYEQAASLVGRMATLQDAAEYASYLTDLKERHKRKRNFMKLLQ